MPEPRVLWTNHTMPRSVSMHKISSSPCRVPRGEHNNITLIEIFPELTKLLKSTKSRPEPSRWHERRDGAPLRSPGRNGLVAPGEIVVSPEDQSWRRMCAKVSPSTSISQTPLKLASSTSRQRCCIGLVGRPRMMPGFSRDSHPVQSGPRPLTARQSSSEPLLAGSSWPKLQHINLSARRNLVWLLAL